MTDDNGCIVPFERSRIADRRGQGSLSGADAATGEPAGYRRRRAGNVGHARDFSIAGELIARVSNLDAVQTGGRWKELELYQTPAGRYVCLEIWRTVWEGQYDQYWLASCDDLKAARAFFGASRLVVELFEQATTRLVGMSP